jgi:hypothetical protein
MSTTVERTALEGMKRAETSAVEHAHALSRSFEAQTPEEADAAPSTVDAIVGLQVDRHAYSASAKVLAVAQRLSKAILDIFA